MRGLGQGSWIFSGRMMDRHLFRAGGVSGAVVGTSYTFEPSLTARVHACGQDVGAGKRADGKERVLP